YGAAPGQGWQGRCIKVGKGCKTGKVLTMSGRSGILELPPALGGVPGPSGGRPAARGFTHFVAPVAGALRLVLRTGHIPGPFHANRFLPAPTRGGFAERPVLVSLAGACQFSAGGHGFSFGAE